MRIRQDPAVARASKQTHDRYTQGYFVKKSREGQTEEWKVRLVLRTQNLHAPCMFTSMLYITQPSY